VVNIDYRLAPQAKMADIYEDVEDAAKWIRNVLPKELGEGIVDTETLIVGGGSCGGLLALTAGLFMSPPPKAVISIYSLVDPTDPEFNIASKPNPPPGRSELIPWSEVEEYLGENAPTVSHPENGLNMREYTYKGRATANFYLIQEGLLLSAVHGPDATPESVQERWGVVKNMTPNFPPTWVAHAEEDRYTPVTEAHKLVKALEREGVEHEWWSIKGKHDHGFDFWEMEAGEAGEFEKDFAGRLWPWLEKTLSK
jgi:acetyl esterase/lipase